MKRVALIAVLAGLFMAAAPVRVATIPFAALVRLSSTIVVGRVERIESAGKTRGALVRVEQVLCGDCIGKYVAFLASPTWNCDIATAVLDERVLLFLHAPSDKERAEFDFEESAGSRARDQAVLSLMLDAGPLLRISHSGRGRMPIHVGSKDEHVEAYGDITELATDWTTPCDTCRDLYRKPLAEVEAAIREVLPPER